MRRSSKVGVAATGAAEEGPMPGTSTSVGGERGCADAAGQEQQQEEEVAPEASGPSVEEVMAALKDAEERARASQAKVTELEARLLEQGSSLQSRLDNALETIEELQDRYNAKIAKLRTEIDVCNRRVQNAKYVSEANEVLAAESQVHQLLAESRAMDMRVRVERLGSRLQAQVSTQTVEKLRHGITATKIGIFDLESNLRQLYADPQLNAPLQSAKRRQVERLEKRLSALRTVYASETQLKAQLELVMHINDQLCTAAARGDVDTARMLLRRGVSVNVVDKDGYNPLLYACGAGQLAMVRELVEQGADLVDEDAKDKPLVLAARNGHAAVVQLLIQRGTPVDSAEAQSHKTALHVAAEQGHEAVVEMLLNCGANVNKPDALGNTPLHVVARTAYLTIAVLLIDRGADMNVRNLGGGETPMELAYSGRNFSFVSVISRYLGQEVGVANPPPYSLAYNPLDPKAAEALLASINTPPPQQPPDEKNNAMAAPRGLSSSSRRGWTAGSTTRSRSSTTTTTAGNSTLRGKGATDSAVGNRSTSSSGHPRQRSEDAKMATTSSSGTARTTSRQQQPPLSKEDTPSSSSLGPEDSVLEVGPLGDNMSALTYEETVETPR